jgi:hypothetical protein
MGSIGTKATSGAGFAWPASAPPAGSEPGRWTIPLQTA